ncbi:aminotransferase class IV [bacterium]|nr:aminotransferase class IV [bacterium]
MPLSEGRVSVEDRGFQFADGIYEAIRCYDGVPLMLDEHLQRFENSARAILIEPPGTRDERAENIRSLVRESGFGDCLLYGQLTRGASPRKHTFPLAKDCPPTELWYVRELQAHAPEHYRDGVALLSHPDERWARCNIKSLALLPNVLAKERARRAGCFEALLYREDGTVTECGASNAYCVIDGVVRTHPLNNRILPGVTRLLVLQVAREEGVEVVEEAVTLDEFAAAPEAFISSTTMEIMPATRLDGKPIGNGQVGPVTRSLMGKVNDRARAMCAAAQLPG